MEQSSSSPLIEAANNITVTLCTEPSVNIHCHSDQLPQRGQSLQEYNNDSASLHCLHCTSQKVGCQGLKVLRTGSSGVSEVTEQLPLTCSTHMP